MPRLLLSTPDIRRVGQAARTVAALAKMDGKRVESHQQTLADLKATRATLETRQRSLASVRAAAQNAQDASQRAVQARTALIRDIDTRRDLNAQLAGELQTVQQKLQLALRDLSRGAADDRSRRLPLKPFRGDLDWPAPGSVSAAASGATSFHGIEVAAARGNRRPGHPRRDRRICGHFCRIRQSRHPGSRIADVQPVRRPPGYRRQERRACRTRSTGRRGRADPDRRRGAVLRASRRRSAGRPATMVEEKPLEVHACYELTHAVHRHDHLRTCDRLRDRGRFSRQGDGAFEDTYQQLKIFDDVVEPDHEQLRRGGRPRQGDARRDARSRRRPRS